MGCGPPQCNDSRRPPPSLEGSVDSPRLLICDSLTVCRLGIGAVLYRICRSFPYFVKVFEKTWFGRFAIFLISLSNGRTSQVPDKVGLLSLLLKIWIQGNRCSTAVVDTPNLVNERPKSADNHEQSTNDSESSLNDIGGLGRVARGTTRAYQCRTNKIGRPDEWRLRTVK